MENQHKRDLTQDEINLLNEIKLCAETVARLVESLELSAKSAHIPGPDGRWVSIGKTHLQQGFMALARAVAQPTTF